MSFGRNSTFFDIYIERDLKNGTLDEAGAQELIDNIVMKLRIVRFLRTKTMTPSSPATRTGRPGPTPASATTAAPWSPRPRSVCSTR